MKKDVEAFKRELGNYNYYRLNLEGTMELIEINEEALSNLHGIDPSKEHVSSGTAWVESEAFQRISDELDRLHSIKDLRTKQIAYIESVLNGLSEETRTACLEIYVKKKTYSEVANRKQIDSSTLFRRIENELSNLLDSY